MAKSSRSKSKRAFRATKRTSATSNYQKTESERLLQLWKNLTESLGEGSESATLLTTQEEMQIDKGAEDQQDSTSKSAPKVSTHGPRMSGQEV
ncbi:hypothetical protein MJO28_014342 [Puccinia striiformis f. sp. tritici]|uniref:DUF2423 domain-containing protein n=2 Tax=Puccinia striiformis TaxID=27350 RepID=A0A2S4VYQ4_9BASI|nr:hypothetical protein Pst134EB_027360 [Puccinia striiformis f. sp. tritici]KAI7938763.1 hypothetical protein MJO28_014342 [Puccinia striiformis f. sp. tritici]KAI9626491.1 hypothetical protein KEM48_010315 [Puccinia striiformis f. sp. tritici PST-130]POW14662.1 hypothetical protein PSTT_02799 [Puccinia striiformis]